MKGVCEGVNLLKGFSIYFKIFVVAKYLEFVFLYFWFKFILERGVMSIYFWKIVVCLFILVEYVSFDMRCDI